MTTFTAVTGRALSRALQSLSDSSALAVSVGALEWRAERLNSPYLSHREVMLALRDKPLPPGVVLISNGVHTIAAAPRVWNAIPAAPAGHEWREAMIPAAPVHAVVARVAALVPGLAAEVRAALADLGGTPLVTAFALLREVVSWTEDGRPVYAEPELAPASPGELDDLADALAGIPEATFAPDEDAEDAEGE